MASPSPPPPAPGGFAVRPLAARAPSTSSSIVPDSDTASASSHVARDVRLPHHHHHHHHHLSHSQDHHYPQHHHHHSQSQSQSSLESSASSSSSSFPRHRPHHVSSHHQNPSTSSDALRNSPAHSPPSPAATPSAAPVSVSESTSIPPGAPPPSVVRVPIKRKPLSSTASIHSLVPSARSSNEFSFPLPPSYAAGLPKPDQRFARRQSIDSPTFYDFASSARASVPAAQSPLKLATVDSSPPDVGRVTSRDPQLDPPSAELSDVLSEYDDLISEGSDAPPDAARDGTPTNALEDSCDDIESLYADNINHSPFPPSSMFAPKPTPPHLKLNKVESSAADHAKRQSNESPPASSGTPPLDTSQYINKPLPKSPGQASPFASLFGWSHPSPSVTDFSSVPSPLSPTRNGSTNDALRTSKSLSNPRAANAAQANPINYCEHYLSTPPPSNSLSSIQVEEMEEELKAISSELAASIRREMDLEDLVDRLQEQANNPQAPSKRTSDYFSDSGYSSAKASDYDQSKEEIEKIQRRSEQEKASIRLELSNKLQDERSKRKALDQQIKDLAEKASQMDLAHMNNLDASDRVRDLENTCEDLRRRLSEERQSKTNFEDLLTALKGELQDACNERDNLRDEVVPQLRARVEGLESEAAEYANLTYESTKMQQQLQSLQKENTSLRNSQSGPPEGFRMSGLARSNSVAASSFRPRGPPPSAGLSRSGSVKNVQTESREQLAERLKDVEAQRDALHSALKNLLERQEFQNRENQKKIRILEMERQRLLSENPKKAGFEKDIKNLRTEINVLRRRAEDALEQKWQVEKGLVGLKMDLDRAEAEIADLRSLLKEKDILIPPSLARSSGSDAGIPSVPITSESLGRAYRELQDAYNDSLNRIKQLELHGTDGGTDEKTKLAMDRLEKSLAAAVSERDVAKQQVSALQGQVDGLAAVETHAVGRERSLAEELSESASRVEQLAAQVRQQLASNAQLRDRLAETVARGDTERKANSERISWLQERLHELEEQLVAAQTTSEERVGRHEEELSRLRDAHSEQLRRIGSGAGVGMTSAPKSPLLRTASGQAFVRASQAVPAKSFDEEIQIKALRERVTELEKALADAEAEIEQVVFKMNTAQIEVMNLQEEREGAIRETKRLQKVIEAEQAKSFEERFKTLSSVVA
ncbi:hypothetical protein JDV02_001538 [Purpureocillium takamizusanense]|uniref:DUF7603 domain-containing protein n=1 Tax=Purpureocillium takamizusanense TaxID=2060973 RepID=A0A9Q8Q9S4_9HYPO|nr:uncharacterized protein JDV02_001538 [Purpureocillium takamizusanense]UNI14962.1 hypothetical protein JDV02_001538 [Purpureocillium takamizusanense]